MSDYLVQFNNISKFFGKVIALKDVTMKLKKGEIMCLLGDNGAGKSTLLRILCLLMNPNVGEMHHRNLPIKEQRNTWLKQIGALSHESRFYNDLTARENLKL